MLVKSSPLSYGFLDAVIPGACSGAATCRKPTRSVIPVIALERLWGDPVPESEFFNGRCIPAAEGGQP